MNKNKDDKIENIRYITIWVTNKIPNLEDYLKQLKINGINTILFDIRWVNHEKKENEYNFEIIHTFCSTVIKYGFKIMPLISIYYCPQWIIKKYDFIREVNASLNSKGKPINISYSHVDSIKHSSLFTEKIINELEIYRNHILGISICWNNEHETKFTQTHNLFRPFDKSANDNFKDMLKNINSSIDFWNSRWDFNYSNFNEINLTDIHKGHFNNFGITTNTPEKNQRLYDFFHFRIKYLLKIYKIGCSLIKKYNYKTFLHFGELFTSHDSIYQSDILFHMITEDWLDIVLIDTNMMCIGDLKKNNILGYILSSLCKQYNKEYIFELALERYSDTMESIKYAIQYSNNKHIGIANLIAAPVNEQEVLLKYIKNIDQFDFKEKKKKALLIYSITGSLALFGPQKDWYNSITNEPIHDFLMEEFSNLYNDNFDIDIIGDLKNLKNINLNFYCKVVFLETLVILSSERNILTKFTQKLTNKDFTYVKLPKKYFGYLDNFEKFPIELLDMQINVKPQYIPYMLLVKNRYIFDWTEKCGCTTLIKSIFNYLGILDEAINYNSWIHNYREEIYYKKYGMVTDNMLKNDNYIKIKLVRNPYTRIVSSYFAAHENNKQFLKKYLNEDLSFYDFLILIKEEKIKNAHWKLQFKPNIKYNEILKLENIDKEYIKLNTKYDLNLQNLNNETHFHSINKNLDGLFVGFQKYSEFKNYKNVPDYKNFYNSEIKELVTSIYKKDIEEFNYKFPF